MGTNPAVLEDTRLGAGCGDGRQGRTSDAAVYFSRVESNVDVFLLNGPYEAVGVIGEKAEEALSILCQY
jgi:hypothetical protein